MTDVLFWSMIDTVCRLAVAFIVVVKLTKFYERYHADERVGLGLAGGCAFMSALAPVCSWSSSLFAVGVMIYFAGRLRRQFDQYWSHQ